jgi:transposase
MNVRPYDQNQKLLLPHDLRDFLPPEHEVHMINDIIERFDLSCFYEAIPEVGNPSYHPRLMIKILFYGVVQGITSSRVVARKCCLDVAYMYLAAMQKPDFRTISKFRIRHLLRILSLFAQIVTICQDMGLVSMDHIAIDGTRLKANASASELFDRERARRHQDRLKDEIRQRLEHMLLEGRP